MRPNRLAGPLLLASFLLPVVPAAAPQGPSGPAWVRPAAGLNAPAGPRSFTELERDGLVRAQASTSALEDLRGSHDIHLTDHDLTVVAIVLLAVIVLAIIF